MFWKKYRKKINMKRIIAVIGARPQFIKHFAFEKACQGKVELKTIHTGQHYDENMSKVFFDQLGMNKPDYMLDVRSGSHGIQTSKMMVEIEKILLEERPDYLVLYGDTNSTLAGAIVASKIHIPIAHIEAGLRSFNKEMPEEVNRILTDHVSDLLFTPSQLASNHLRTEGITKGVHLVGDIMKDLVAYCKDNNVLPSRDESFDYYYTTIHRPHNTDDRKRLEAILKELNSLDKKVIFSIHPRTTNFMNKYDMDVKNYSNITFIEPQPYFENLSYLLHSSGLITDSGGMQKEAYWLNKKCITIRKETEWMETLSKGANTLIFADLNTLAITINEPVEAFDQNLYGNGKTAERILDLLS